MDKMWRTYISRIVIVNSLACWDRVSAVTRLVSWLPAVILAISISRRIIWRSPMQQRQHWLGIDQWRMMIHRQSWLRSSRDKSRLFRWSYCERINTLNRSVPFQASQFVSLASVCFLPVWVKEILQRALIQQKECTRSHRQRHLHRRDQWLDWLISPLIAQTQKHLIIKGKATMISLTNRTKTWSISRQAWDLRSGSKPSK